MLFFYVSYSVFKGDLALKMWKSMGRNIAAGFGDDASIQSFGQVSWEVCQYIPYSLICDFALKLMLLREDKWGTRLPSVLS